MSNPSWLLIVLTLPLMINSTPNNETAPVQKTISGDCEACLDAGGTFFKHVYMAQSVSRYTCRYMPPPSNFSWIVDRVCEKPDCSRIEFRPVRIILTPEEMKCSTPLGINLDAFPPLYTTNTSIHFSVADCNQDNNNNNNTPTIPFDFGILSLLLLLSCAVAGQFLILIHLSTLVKKGMRIKSNQQEMKPLTGRRG